MSKNEQAKDLLAKEKRDVAAPAEQTRPGRVFVPDVDIYEKDGQIILLADMPGVEAKDLHIDLKDNVLTIEGNAQEPEAGDEADILREYETGRYFRQFTLSNAIDQEKIEAKLTDGVMKLILPKVQKAQPRKITVQAG